MNESNNLSTNFVFSGEQSPKEFGWCEGGQQGDSCHPGGSHVLSLPATVRGGGTAGRSREEGLTDGSPQVRKVRQLLTTIYYIHLIFTYWLWGQRQQADLWCTIKKSDVW